MRETLQFFRRVNLRHMRGRRLRTALTISGVGAGVALVFSISVINASLVENVRASVRSLGGEAEIEVAAPDPSGLPGGTVARVQGVEGVEKAFPATRTVSAALGDGVRRKALWLGVTLDFASLFPRDLGSLDDVEISGGAGVVGGGAILASELAQRIDVAEGDRIEVMTPHGPRPVEVAGIISGGALQTINGGDFGLLALPAAQQLFAKEDRVDSIYVVTDPDVAVEDVESRLDEELGGGAVIGPPGERATVFERTFATLQLLTSMAGLVALFVALFVVYNTMSMTVAERRREVSLGLALGMRRRQVFGAFLGESAMLGLVASIGGIAAGYLLARYLVETAIDGYRFILPETTSGDAVVTTSALAFALVGGVAISMMGAFLPVRRVLTVAPIEFLRPHVPWGGDGPLARGPFLRIVTVASMVGSVAGLFLYMRAPGPGLAAVTLIVVLTSVSLLLPWVMPLAIRVVSEVFRRVFGTIGRLAGDALARNARRTMMTAAALLLSLGMVVGVGSAIGSLEAQLQSRSEGWFGAPLFVSATTATGFGSDQPLPATLAGELREVDGVADAYPGRYSLINVKGDQTVIYAIPLAQAAGDGTSRTLTAPGVDQGEFIQSMDRGQVWVSRYTARRLDLDVGDAIELPTPFGKRSFEVGGSYDDLVPFDSMYMEQRVYARHWDDDRVDQFAIYPDEGTSISTLEENLEAFVASTDAPVRVSTREEVIGRVQDISQGLVSVARGIQLAAMIVAALTIANTMLMAVLERRWEFGLERAVGMGEKQLKNSVLLEAGGIGLIGGGGGVIFGTAVGLVILFMMEQSFAWRIPFQPQWALIALAIGGGVILSAVAAAYPRRVAARLPIVECLRYE